MRANPKHVKLFHWGKLLTITGGAQALVQGLSLISGILVIQLLPTREYAWYTIVNTMLGSMVILSDGGIGIGVMAEGAKVWQNKENLGIVRATGLALRKRFAIVSLIIAMPILIFLLLHHEANWKTTLLISASLVPVLYASLSDSLLEIFPKLHQDLISLQKNQLAVSASRLLLTGLTLFLFPFAFVAMLASGIPRMYGNIRLAKIANIFSDKHQKPDKQIKKRILKVVNRIMPEAIYYCLSGQITIWLISIFGKTTAVAQIGALGRLAMTLNIFTAMFSIIVIPRYAKLQNNKMILFRRLFQIISGMLFICVFVVLIVWTFPHQTLWILGEKYKNLDTHLLFLSICGSCLNLFGASFLGLSTSRGWAIHPFLSIITSLTATVCGIILFDISSIKGVLEINIFIALFQLVMHGCYAILKIANSKDYFPDF